MTQSEQGDEPQHPVRPAHEGVVLPPAQQQWQPPQPSQAPGPMPGHAPGQAAPQQGQSWGQPWGPGAAQGTQAPGPVPAQQPRPLAPQQWQQAQQAQESQAGQAQMPQGAFGEPQGQQMQQPVWGAPVQSGGDAEPTQYMQPVPAEPVGPGSDAEPTQFMPPVPSGPGALPPEAPAGQPGAQQGVQQGGQLEGTQFLGGQALQPPAGSDADATQYLPPVPADAPYAARPDGVQQTQQPQQVQQPQQAGNGTHGAPVLPGVPGERQPPAEFDSLFRTQPPTPGAQPEPAGSTQQMPRFLPPRQQEAEQEEARYQQFQQPAPRGGGPGGPEQRRRKISPVPLIAAVVVGCSVIGLGISALMNAGEDDKDTGATNTAAGSKLPNQEPAEKAADGAKGQAQALDKLLADSNDSRASVINAVAAIGQCGDLSKAATDLRAAATQRRGLVTRLQSLKVDKLEGNQALTAALNGAWEASAAADDHYASWADKVAGDKDRFCRDGRAKATSERRAGDRESGKASQQKQQAVNPWNTIAEKYGLTKHQASEL
ncbi:hypothetical protein GCM10010329_49480 [Streptomyces spiroverticillatus]|uniref:Uncharacterized protein n=1 Tax=Streptomyces finlayi TaxID=67296 RepID=A0A919CC56_9ACTN|nr:hypothetical protein [Streptomyces finlayi]GHA20286.1 hypothetical protein GCM10010329_49480 [Streptomyces spiroverticillatus]GHD03103.1 hypothetical protein GCM10010334_50430 [Streptomyces finlayi]